MAIATSSYYGLTKVRETSPSAADWAATDSNFELLGLILKALEQHHHTGTAGILYPGYNSDPTKIILPTLTSSSSGGIMTPGTSVGVKLSYTDGSRLETAAGPEQDITLPAAIEPPSAPTLTSLTAASNALGGGVYIYAMTKTNGSGETTISSVLPVQVLYDQTYNAAIGFNPISSYTDGTTGLNIYRAAGQGAAFQLLTSITGSSTSSFTDTNTIAPGNQNVQPPTSSTFNATYKVHIDWSALSFPAAASFINVYVTQQAGIWGTNCLLTTLPITGGSPPTSMNYLGSEALAAGTPKYGSSIVSSPPKISLSTEATGAPVLTTDQDFATFQAKGMRLENSSGVPAKWFAPQTGAIYYDTSTKNVRAYINGTWTNWGTASTSTYTHPTQESGGHIAANIPHSATSGVALKTILDRVADTTSGARIQVLPVSSVDGTAGTISSTSTTGAAIPDLSVTFTPQFNNQLAEITASIVLSGDTLGMNINIYASVTLAGSTITSLAQTWTVPIAKAINTMYLSFPLQFPTGTSTVAVYWLVNTGTVTASANQRILTVKGLY